MKKLILVSILLLTIGFCFGMIGVWAGDGELPRVKVACENKVGLLTAIDDGFSILKKCPKNSRKVILGEIANGNNEVNKEVIFEGPYTLKSDKTVWWFDQSWVELSERKLPDEVLMENIVDWDNGRGSYFVLEDESVYVWMYIADKETEGWMNVGNPYWSTE